MVKLTKKAFYPRARESDADERLTVGNNPLIVLLVWWKVCGMCIFVEFRT